MLLKENNTKELKKLGFKGDSTESLLKEVSKYFPQFINGTNISNVWWVHLKDSNNNDLEGALVKEYIKKNGN